MKIYNDHQPLLIKFHVGVCLTQRINCIRNKLLGFMKLKSAFLVQYGIGNSLEETLQIFGEKIDD